MKYTEEHRQFILDTLLPYKTGEEKKATLPSGQCVYLCEDGRMCPVGKWMRKGPWQESRNGVILMLPKFGAKNVFKKKAFEMNLTLWVWMSIQSCHDGLEDNSFKRRDIRELEDTTGLKFPELI